MNLLEQISVHLGSSALIAFPLVFIGGVLSAFNPCCVPMIPTIVVLVGTHRAVDKFKAAIIAALFVMGFAVMTAIFGALTTSVGLIFGRIGKGFSYAVALIPFLMALQLWGFIRLKMPIINGKAFFDGHYLGAFITGLGFAVVITPCATPILATILAFAISTKSVVYGTSLLFVYGIGTGLPLIVMGSFMGFLGSLNKVAQYRRHINLATTSALVATSAYLIWNTYHA